MTNSQWIEIEGRARDLGIGRGELLRLASEALGEVLPAIDPKRVTFAAAEVLIRQLRSFPGRFAQKLDQIAA